MTVWTFKTSSDFGNEGFLDICLDGINRLDEVEDSLSSMELRFGAGCPDTSITESLNTFWKNMLEVKTQKLDRFNHFGWGHVRANVVSANRTEQNRTEQNRTEQRCKAYFSHSLSIPGVEI